MKMSFLLLNVEIICIYKEIDDRKKESTDEDRNEVRDVKRR